MLKSMDVLTYNLLDNNQSFIIDTFLVDEEHCLAIIYTEDSGYRDKYIGTSKFYIVGGRYNFRTLDCTCAKYDVAQITENLCNKIVNGGFY